MAEKLIISPVSRVSGLLAVELDIDQGKVTDARLKGTSVRGIENILTGQDPGDLSFISQRICAECSPAHAIAASQALEEAWEIDVPDNGRLMRNIVLAMSMISRNVGWFYHRGLADYIDFSALTGYTGKERALVRVREQIKEVVAKGEGGPFLPQSAGDLISDAEISAGLFSHSLDAFRLRRMTDEVIALLSGRSPNGGGIVPGGMTMRLDGAVIASLVSRLREISDWTRDIFVADVLALVPQLARFKNLGVGVPNFMSFGAFPLEANGENFIPRGVITGGDITIVEDLRPDTIEEDLSATWYNQDIGSRHPSEGATEFSPSREEGYTFVKAARYGGRAIETGSLARMLAKQEPTLLQLRSKLGVGQSVLARMISRAVEAGLLADEAPKWVEDLKKDAMSAAVIKSRPDRDGSGLIESPGGSLSHWLRIESGSVNLFQVVGGGTWNASPRDADGNRGPIEAALIGTAVPDTANPTDVLRVIRSFDPCLYCATH